MIKKNQERLYIMITRKLDFEKDFQTLSSNKVKFEEAFQRVFDAYCLKKKSQDLRGNQIPRFDENLKSNYEKFVNE